MCGIIWMQVTCHLIKLFDNTADLEFQDNKEKSRNIALGMYSKEKEYVPFTEEFECFGQVFWWFNLPTKVQVFFYWKTIKVSETDDPVLSLIYNSRTLSFCWKLIADNAQAHHFCHHKVAAQMAAHCWSCWPAPVQASWCRGQQRSWWACQGGRGQMWQLHTLDPFPSL